MTEPAIVASVLGADYSRLAGEVLDLQAAGVDRIQWDVMDGRFVPNLTFGAAVVGACRPYVDLPFEAHLMVEDPDHGLEEFVSAGCSTVIVHVEACGTCTARSRGSGTSGHARGWPSTRRRRSASSPTSSTSSITS